LEIRKDARRRITPTRRRHHSSLMLPKQSPAPSKRVAFVFHRLYSCNHGIRHASTGSITDAGNIPTDPPEHAVRVVSFGPREVRRHILEPIHPTNCTMTW